MNVILQKRIKTLRKLRGFTQIELAKRTGLTQRIIAYYEKEVYQIPSDNLIKLAKSLKVSVDELLGLKKINGDISTEEAIAWKNFKKIIKLPKNEQMAIIQFIKTFTSKKKVVKFTKP